MTTQHQDILSNVTDFIQSDVSQQQLSKYIINLTQKIKSQPFLYAYLRDLIVALEKRDCSEIEKQLNLLKTLAERLKHFHHWQTGNNKTIELIEQNIIHANEIKPHIRFSDADYKKFYDNQNEIIGERLKKHKKTPLNRFKSHTDLVFKKNYDHMIRKSHALNVIETYMAILENLDIGVNKKWLDVGCGNGLIANAVNSKRHTKNQWQIHGCDLQDNKIQVAKNKACKNRYFYQENVLDKLQNNNLKETEFDIISMFEFCEHFADPFSLLKDISKNNFKIMVIATPLEQKLNNINDSVPDPVHLWSFTTSAMIKMIKELGLKIIYHSEIGAGRYTRGLDWLTIIAVKNNFFNFFEKKFNYS